MSERNDLFTSRLTAVRSELDTRSTGLVSPEARTAPDPSTGETWSHGNIWAHIHEFVPYWLEQISMVTARSHGLPISFGRTKRDPGRVAAVHDDAHRDPTELWADTQPSLDATATFLNGLDEDAWNAIGQHETLGTMGLTAMLDEFLVGHLEEHAAQLRSLIDDPRLSAES